MERTRKKLIIVVVVVFVNVLLFGKFCLGNRDQFSAEKINARISAKAFIAGVQKRAKNRLVDPSQLSQKMINNLSKYQDRAKTWSIVQQEEKNDDLLKWYRKEITLILQGLNQKKPEGVDNFFTEEEKEEFFKCPDEVIKAYLSRNFGKNAADKTSVFGKARKSACDLQLNKLVKDVYPTEKEVDYALTQNRISALRSTILGRLVKRQKGPVFSENVAVLSTSFIDPMLNDAKSQFKKQGSIVSNSSGSSYVVPEDIASSIKNEIAQYQKGLKKEKQRKTITKVYSIFPSVESKVSVKSREIAISKFRDSVSSTTLSIDQNAFKKMIKANLSNHADKDKSWNSCFASFHNVMANKAVDIHTAKAGEKKRAAFRKFLSSLIFNSDKSCKDAVNKLVERSLKKGFESIRKEISQEQFKEFFKPLEDNTWNPSENEIDKWYNRSLNISEPLKIPGVSSKSFDPSTLFKETVEMVRRAEESAIRKGLNVLKGQMSAIEKLESQMKREVQTMTSPTIEKVIQSYTEKLKKDYPNLFKRAQDDIRRRARDILEAEVKRKADAAKARARDQLKDKGRSDTLSIGPGAEGGKEQEGGSEKSGQTPGGGGSGTDGGIGPGKGPGKQQEELGDEMPDVILDFGHESGRTYADIMFPKESKDKIRLFMDLNVNLNSSNIVMARKLFAGWIRDAIKRSKKDQQEINLYVFARVFQGNFVLYRMVYYFRECLIGALEDVNDKKVKIHWHDKLFDAPDDIKKYRGRPILPPKFNKKTMPRLWV